MDDIRRTAPYYHSDSRQPSTNTSDQQRIQQQRDQGPYLQQPTLPQLPQLPPPANYTRDTYRGGDYIQQQQQQQQQQQYQQDQQQRQIQYQHQQHQEREQGQRQLLQQQQEQTIKREREREHLPSLNMSYAKDEGPTTRGGVSTRGGGAAPATREDPMPSTSDFVKKLYKMLEDPAFQPVVCWGPLGDCFVVKDMNEFTKSILPRMFKHSNFASFVRQLNKYDFHKVKNTDDNQFGEHSWTFRHPDFHADRRDALENIKRKVPAQRKAAKNAASSSNPPPSANSSNHQPYPSQSPGPSGYHHGRGRSHHDHGRGTYTRSPSPESPYASSGGHPHHHSSSHHHRDGASGAGGGSGGGGGGGSSSSSQAQINTLTSEVARLKDESDELRARIRGLERNYESVLLEIVGFQRGMKQQDGIVQSLIGLVLDSGGSVAGVGASAGVMGGNGKGA